MFNIIMVVDSCYSILICLLTIDLTHQKLKAITLSHQKLYTFDRLIIDLHELLALLVLS